jgi:hypothetical protein
MKKFASLFMSCGLSVGLALAGCGSDAMSPTPIPDPIPNPNPNPNPNPMTGTLTGTVAANQTISGAISMTGDVTVPAGVTLTVAAGTVVTAAGNFSLSIKGTLVVQGTAASPVQFVGASAASWGGIAVSGTGTANLSYVTINDASQAFAALAGTTYALDHVTIQHAGSALVLSSTGTVNKTVIVGQGPNQSMSPVSIQGGSPSFTDLQVTNGAGNPGLDAVVVSGTSSPKFDHVEVTGYHCAFHFGGGSNITISNSYVHDNYYAVMVFGATPFTFSNSNILRNQTTNIGDCSGPAITVSGNYFGAAAAFDTSCKTQTNATPAAAMLTTAGYRP